MRFRSIGAFVFGLSVASAPSAGVSAQQPVTTPEQEFGHEIGADYQLVNYTELYEYFRKFAGESDRMTVEDIGLTEEGRPQVMAVITSPANLRSRFDVLILEDGAVPSPTGGRGSGSTPDASRLPAEYRDRIGALAQDRTRQSTHPRTGGSPRRHDQPQSALRSGARRR